MSEAPASAGHPLVDPERPLRAALPWLLLVAGAAILGGLFDAGTFKLGATALLAGLPLCALLAFVGRDAAAAWFPSWPGRLLLLIVALGVFAARGSPPSAALLDALLLFGLANLAAVLGLRAAEHDSRALERGVLLVGALSAVAAVLQALDVDLGLDGGPSEVVALSGNSTRAGVLLAMAVAAGVTALAGGLAEGRGDDPHSQRPARYPLARWSAAAPRLALLALLVTAWLLTRARGARLAALLALAVVGAAAWWRAKHPARSERTPVTRRAPPAGRLALALLGVALLGLVATHALGGRDAVLGRKLADSGPILEGRDLTTNVRLSVWSGSVELVADAPMGRGPGGFRAAFPAYRDPLEAARPGLAGAVTEVRHPHNELLLVAAEAGVLGALLALVLALATTWRALRRCVDEAGPTQRTAAAVFLTGLFAACLQDALHDPATALPFWAAVGVIWSPRPQEARAWWLGKRSTGVLVAALGVALALVAWPRLDAHLSLRSAMLAVRTPGHVHALTIGLLERAVEAAPRDPDVLQVAQAAAQTALRDPHNLGDVPLQVRLVQLIERTREALDALQPTALPPHADRTPP